MILVDIYVPSVDQSYDFRLDQNTTIASVIDEITELIVQKEKSSASVNPEELVLCSREYETVLPPTSTLAQCGITTGAGLILV